MRRKSNNSSLKSFQVNRTRTVRKNNKNFETSKNSTGRIMEVSKDTSIKKREPLYSNVQNPLENKATFISALSERNKQIRLNQEVQNNVAVQGYGVVDPLRPEKTIRVVAPANATVYEILEKSCEMSEIRKRHIKFFMVQIGTRDLESGTIEWSPVHQQAWRKRRVREGQVIRFRLLPRGGGDSGKSTLATVLTIVVGIAAMVIAPQISAVALANMPSTLAGVATQSAIVASKVIGAVAGLAVTSVGMALVNAIAPVSDLDSSRQESASYSIAAGSNPLNPYGKVPAPVGYGKILPPKAAYPYTILNGDDSYLHELFCVGIGDIDVSQLKIGETPISEYIDMEYEYFTYEPSKKNVSQLFPTGIIQDDSTIELSYNVSNVRTTTICDSAILDFYFAGLGYNNDKGGVDHRTVRIIVQYKESGSTEEWTGVPNYRYLASSAISIKNYHYYRAPFKIYASSARGVFATGDDYTPLKNEFFLGRYEITSSGIYQRTSQSSYRFGEIKGIATAERSYAVDEYGPSSDNYPGGQYLGKGYYLSFSGGEVSNVSLEAPIAADQSFTANVADILRRSINISFPKRGVYDIRVTKVTPDSTDTKEMTDITWSSLKSVSTDIPVDTPYPVNLLAVRIKASGQLNGNLDSLSMIYNTRMSDWDKTSQTWVHRETSNPASIFRYALQNELIMARPQSDIQIDLHNLQDAHEYWESKNWTYNRIWDSDNSVFERLVEVCSVGLASPTMIEGRWGTIIDRPRTTVDCVFTEANSFNWSFSRTTVALPTEIHATFINEETWEEDTVPYVTDAPDIGYYISENQSVNGAVNATHVYELTRHHYYDAKLHVRTFSFRAYDEAILCSRGSLIECAVPSITPSGLQTGRIRQIIVNSSNEVVRLVTDQVQSTVSSEGRRYGVKVFTENGNRYQSEVKAENQSSQTLNLVNPIRMDDLQAGDKYAFGDYDYEVFPAIVLGMQFNSDFTCDISAQDYIPQLYELDEEEVPPFQSVITRPVIVQAVGLDAYEVWIADGRNGQGHSDIFVNWSGNYDKWNIFVDMGDGRGILQIGSTTTNFYKIENAKYGATYKIYVTPYDVANNAPFDTVVIAGKQAPPSNVQNFRGIQSGTSVTLLWNHIPDSDKAGYEIRHGDSWGTAEVLASGISDNSYIWEVPINGSYQFLIKAIDTSGNYSLVATPFLMSLEVESLFNIVLTWSELPESFDEAERVYNFQPIEDKTKIVWLPSTPNIVGSEEWTNTSFGDYSGSSADGVYISKVHDLTVQAKSTIRVSVSATMFASGLITNEVYPERTNMTYPQDTNLNITSESHIKKYIRTSIDNVTWTDWVEYVSPIFYDTRYFQIKIETRADTVFTYISIDKINLLVDVPDKIVLLKEEIIPQEGKTYSLVELGIYPIVVQYIVGVTTLGTTGKYATVEKGEDSFTVRVFDNSGTPIGSQCDLDIRGF